MVTMNRAGNFNEDYCRLLELTPSMTEEHQPYGWMTVREAGDFQAAFYPRWNEKIFRSVIGHFGLGPEVRVEHLSRGMRAGLCLALTLAPDPELLILDDPALGLDPVARRSLVESMKLQNIPRCGSRKLRTLRSRVPAA